MRIFHYTAEEARQQHGNYYYKAQMQQDEPCKYFQQLDHAEFIRMWRYALSLNVL